MTLLEDQEESDDPTVLAKQQLKVMTSLYNICVNQFFAHETSLKAQMVAAKVQETCTNLLLHRLGLVQHEVQRLADHLEKDLDLEASTLDHVQVSIQSFGDKFGNLSDTLKDIVSSHRARYATENELRKKILSEIGGAKEFLQHIRSNTQRIQVIPEPCLGDSRIALRRQRCSQWHSFQSGRFSPCGFECDHGEPRYFDLGAFEQDGT